MAMSAKDELPDETWIAVPNYEESYEVSDAGRVRSIDRVAVRSDGKIYTYKGKLLKERWCGAVGNKCRSVTLTERTNHRVATLVLSAFVGPKPENSQVRHIDLAKGDVLSNLYYFVLTSADIDAIKCVLAEGKSLQEVTCEVNANRGLRVSRALVWKISRNLSCRLSTDAAVT